MLKKLAYGAILWLIPYVTAIPLLPLMKSDFVFFKTIMVVEGALVGGLLAAQYFKGVERNYLREGITLAVVCITLGWLLDFVALLPFTKQTPWRYFLEIGFRYIAIFAPTVAIGYVLHAKRDAAR